MSWCKTRFLRFREPLSDSVVQDNAKVRRGKERNSKRNKTEDQEIERQGVQDYRCPCSWVTKDLDTQPKGRGWFETYDSSIFHFKFIRESSSLSSSSSIKCLLSHFCYYFGVKVTIPPVPLL